MKHGDILFGAITTVGGIGLGFVNIVLGIAVTGTMLFVWIVRARKEWKHRNDPPTNKDFYE